ncbi:LysR substrate-binding domain-containing protein [Noviherbaspirillum sp.]|uniref:LysR substrate-binding domain-containing protein n=1 Tax=Noviherbaspirillum sp. TaxID=1926288 RepID=UPI002D295304|nr:LysR substrate-binding domain-containing protein [Noviherbaspirillum sp.]HZW20991.1 LysR substrate-binding domain-containing protein [Noviherbaspirillum sp.]
MQNELLSLPPLDALRGFVAVARRMSITLAAQDLCLTQSAVSRQVQALEEHLGTPLLVRKHRAIALTEAGRRLFDLASPWLGRLAEYVDSLQEEGRVRPVTITASIGVTSLWLLPRLGSFQAAHPHIDVRVAANNRIVDMAQEGIDVAIRYSRASRVPMGAVRLFGEALVPVASKAVAAKAFKTPSALLQQVLLELDEGGVPWLHWSDWLSAKGFAHAKPKAYLHFNQYDQVIQAAIEGHGVALGRLALVQPMLMDGRLVAQRNAQVGVDDLAYWLVQATEAPREEVKVFSEWIVREAQRSGQGA